RPPFLNEEEALHWARRSIDFAFQCAADVISLIPTRAGNGAMDTLAAIAEFSQPQLATVEAALEYGVRLGKGRVFVALWDLERFSTCSSCFAARAERLRDMNMKQVVVPPVRCSYCAAVGC